MLKKAQVSLEFMIILSIVIILVLGMLKLTQNQITKFEERQLEAHAQSFFSTLKQEIIIASAVKDNYVRRFTLPTHIANKKYDIDIDHLDELTIHFFDKDNTIESFFTVTPIPVKGTFLDITNQEETHCITKSYLDGVRISRNQASLDSFQKSVSSGDTLSVILSFHCIDNIKAFQFSLLFDSDQFEIENIKPIERAVDKNLNPLFHRISSYSGVKGKAENGEDYYIESGNAIRRTYTMRGSECANKDFISGTVANITFKVKSGATKGTSTIAFDSDLEGNELQLWSCETGNDLDFPGSKFDLQVEIV